MISDIEDEEMMLVRIPFAGFYCSIHDMIFDQGLEDSLTITKDNVDWERVRLDYAKAYTEKFSQEIGVPMRFASLSSPTYYNFETDIIFATISRGALADLRDGLVGDAQPEADLDSHVAKVLERREGFEPSYSNDLEDWGPVESWDEPMMGVLLDFAFLRSDTNEYHIADNLSDMASELIWENVVDPSRVPGHINATSDTGASPQGG